MSDLYFYQEVINHIAEHDRKNGYNLVPADSIVGALLANCKILATDNKVDAHTDKAIYLKSFSSEYKDVSAILKTSDKGESTESNKKTQYKIPNFDSELFSQSGWRNGSCQAKTTHLPRLLAWYYWKSEKLTNNKLKRLQLDAGFQSARDFHESVRKNTSYQDASGKLVQLESRFRHFSADLPIASQSVTAGKPAIKRDWIDPYNQDAIPFVGRKAELEQLDEFASDQGVADFKIWSIIAPSGAGKTRLTYEWIQRPHIHENWQILYLGLDVKKKHSSGKSNNQSLVCRDPQRRITQLPGISDCGSEWKNWQPDRPSIFVIDYVFGFAEVIKGIAERCSSQHLAYPVRLLVLDHKFPDELNDLKDDSRWSLLFWYDGERMANIKTKFYNQGQPLDLSATAFSFGGKPKSESNYEDIIRTIIKSTATRDTQNQENNENEPLIEQALVYLKNQPNALYPLFAVMIGDAIREGKDFFQWNRRELANYYLSGKARLPWENAIINEDESFWASSLVCAATAQRGLTLSQLRRWTPSEKYAKPRDLRPILDISGRLISQSISTEIGAFEPDYLGESFFLVYLSRLLMRDVEFNLFCQLLNLGNQREKEKAAQEFLGFTRRLTRNLLNDDQTNSQTKKHWQDLHDFLQPENFEPDSPMCWAISAASWDISAEIKNFIAAQNSEAQSFTDNQSFLQPLAQKFRENIDGSKLLPRKNWSVTMAYQALLFSIPYFRDKYKSANSSSIDIEKLAQELLKYDLPDAPRSLLHISLDYGFQALSEHLIFNGYDFGLRDQDSRTALMIACSNGPEQFALAMIQGMDSFDHQDNQGWTALMYAIRNNHEQAALAMIEKMEALDQQMETGCTALMLACMNDHEQAALAIISKMITFDHRDSEGWTALMMACRENNRRIASALINRMDKLDHQKADGWTALMITCRYDQEELSLEMIEKMDAFHHQKYDGWTALMIACAHNQPRAALAMVKKW